MIEIEVKAELYKKQVMFGKQLLAKFQVPNIFNTMEPLPKDHKVKPPLLCVCVCVNPLIFSYTFM